MREIKFRAFDPEAKKMIYKPETLRRVLYLETDNGFHMGRVKSKENGDWVSFQIMQFTGLKDKNGKEIYEGDICRVLYTDWGSKGDYDPRSIEQYMSDISKIGVVEMYDYEWQFNFGNNRYGEISYGSFHVGAHGRIELIGNIYENPDLLLPQLTHKRTN